MMKWLRAGDPLGGDGDTRMSAPLNVRPTSQSSVGMDVAHQAPTSGRFNQLIAPCRKLSQARWMATPEEEQPVFTTMAGPLRLRW